MKRTIFLMTVMLGVLCASCSKDDSVIEFDESSNLTLNRTSENEVQVDQERIAIIIENFDRTLNLTLENEGNLSEEEIGGVFFEGLSSLGVELYYDLDEYSDAYTNFSDLMANLPLEATSSEEFRDQFSRLLYDVQVNDQISLEEKQILVNQIGVSIAFVDWMESLVEDGGRLSDSQRALFGRGWWKKWGKCVAGTLGSALTGGLAGSAIVPVIGTIIGGIGAGLTGAATFC